MELIAIIFILWLIGCAFPSSGNSYGLTLGEVLGFLACGVVLVLLVFVYNFALAGILITFDWFGVSHPIIIPVAIFGPIVVPMLVAAVVRIFLDRHQLVR
jgi:hypothetical protein